MTYQAIAFLGKILTPGSNVFEYGGGGSTLFCLDRGARVVTVEHDPEWLSLLTDKTRADHLSENWTGLLRQPDRPPVPIPRDPSNPELYVSDDRDFDGLWFQNYAATIDDYASIAFDVVIVDGRGRPSCIKHSVDKVRRGGYLVLDNTERSYYLQTDTMKYLINFRIVLDGYGPTPGATWFTETTIWQRI